MTTLFSVHFIIKWSTEEWVPQGCIQVCISGERLPVVGAAVEPQQ